MVPCVIIPSQLRQKIFLGVMTTLIEALYVWLKYRPKKSLLKLLDISYCGLMRNGLAYFGMMLSLLLLYCCN